MLLNQSKCKCLHIGRANEKEPYEMHNTVLLKTSKEKDLGVTISADWKVSEQCGIAARNGEPATRDDQDKYNIIIEKKLNNKII